MKGLLKKLNTVSISDMYDMLYSSGEDYLVSNLTADTIKKYADYDIDDEYLIVPGTMKTVENHDQYTVNQDQLYEMIINLFYQEQSEEQDDK